MRASDRAYVTLREEILAGSLPPGTVLAEVEQSERLGISRTPLREALRRLSADHLVSPASGRGLVVTDVSLEHAEQLFELRVALEVQAARLAAQRPDRDVAAFADLAARFRSWEPPLARGEDPSDYYALTRALDAALDAAVDNPYLVAALAQSRLHLSRLRRFSHDDPERLAASALEHAAIADAVARGSADAAGGATIWHLDAALARLLHHRPSTADAQVTPRPSAGASVGPAPATAPDHSSASTPDTAPDHSTAPTPPPSPALKEQS